MKQVRMSVVPGFVVIWALLCWGPAQSVSQASQFEAQSMQGIIISGRIRTEFGPLTQQVRVEYWDQGRRIRSIFSDSRGNFTITFDQAGQQSTHSASDVTTSSAGPAGPLGTARDRAAYGRNYAGALLRRGEVKISVPGYHPISISMADRGSNFGISDLGTIRLKRIAKVEGSFLSTVSAAAPKDARKEFTKALKLSEKGKLDEAETRLLKAVELYPNYATAWNSLGQIYEKKNNLEKASSLYARAIQADPKYTVPYLNQAFVQLTLRQPNELLKTTEALLKLDSTLGSAHYHKAVAHYAMRDYEAAEKSARAAVGSLHKPPPKAYLMLGEMLARKGEYAKAAKLIRAYLEAAPPASNTGQARQLLAQLESRIPKEEEPAQANP